MEDVEGQGGSYARARPPLRSRITGTLTRIVEAAQDNKIRSLEDLRREVSWMWTEVYGEEVVGVIQRICPAPLPPVATADAGR